ncbi:hypothetical protein MKZ38_000414 [Zalerion maritima]|uniref:Uncharacterized protein n=1 Tax=Zalerion maritima TaxID=339359 RepID=A0AAD5WVP8_9PEZI|nr:hypothetical protein MKZ38_000414 [Zalerion maritima]
MRRTTVLLIDYHSPRQGTTVNEGLGAPNMDLLLRVCHKLRRRKDNPGRWSRLAPFVLLTNHWGGCDVDYEQGVFLASEVEVDGDAMVPKRKITFSSLPIGSTSTSSSADDGGSGSGSGSDSTTAKFQCKSKKHKRDITFDDDDDDDGDNSLLLTNSPGPIGFKPHSPPPSAWT